MKRKLIIPAFCLALFGLASIAQAQQPGRLPAAAEDATAVDDTSDDAVETETVDAGGAPAEEVQGLPFMPAPPRQYIPPLGYNHYYPGYGSPYMPARLYMCPRPVPPRVGYTYITYQAFAPHEYLHQHARWYYSIHPGSGTTITKISWR
ncbi:MAG: hypothetical protein AB7I37_18305 [Pirellulales bacterium]